MKGSLQNNLINKNPHTFKAFKIDPKIIRISIQHCCYAKSQSRGEIEFQNNVNIVVNY